MSIIYALVANQRIPLAEYSPKSGNFKQIARQIIKEIPKANDKKSFKTQNYLFHHVSLANGLVFLCMVEGTGESQFRIPFMFLDDIKTQFEAKFGGTFQTFDENELDDAFSRILAERMNHYNNPDSDKISAVRGEINVVKKQMVNNIDKVLERGENIEVLVNQTESLKTHSMTYNKKSKEVKKKLWWKNVW
eukprot:CAMPEP_0174262302 /NCGR_PEP_ID=MMETSP0439-20130205/12897_1 /TAXON_ID=0 /ORGANISM="Stereomyxa ramosa, Strain Chinc5" /LENGTH=190 /DNA_ID=CAMNT_0015346993 /DNA_START=53 /DNA_END=622 /DNA_ORIENTATION=+